MARTGADRRCLRAITPLVVCKSAAPVHAGLIVLPALFPDHLWGEGAEAVPIGASSGHGPVRFGVDERYSTEIDNRNCTNPQDSANTAYY